MLTLIDQQTSLNLDVTFHFLFIQLMRFYKFTKKLALMGTINLGYWVNSSANINPSRC